MPVQLAHPSAVGTKSRETMFGPSIRASAERAAAARKEADRLACEAWNKRMLGYRGPGALDAYQSSGSDLAADYLWPRSEIWACLSDAENNGRALRENQRAERIDQHASEFIGSCAIDT